MIKYFSVFLKMLVDAQLGIMAFLIVVKIIIITKDGNRLATLIFLISKIPMANPIMSIPPTAFISLIISNVIQFFTKKAILVINPWYKKTGIAENNTLIPREAAKMIEEIPSRTDFAIRM